MRRLIFAAFFATTIVFPSSTYSSEKEFKVPNSDCLIARDSSKDKWMERASQRKKCMERCGKDPSFDGDEYKYDPKKTDPWMECIDKCG